MGGVVATGLTSENQRRQQGLGDSDPDDQHPRDPRSYFRLTGREVVTQIARPPLPDRSAHQASSLNPTRNRYLMPNQIVITH